MMILLIINIHNNTTKFNAETKLQNKEIEILIFEKVFIFFKSLFANIISTLTSLKILLNNPIYQFMDYKKNYEFFSFNSEYPRFLSNKTIFQFKD